MPPREEPSYYAQIDGSQKGPYTVRELLARRAEGILPPDCFVWREGMVDWRPINEVLPAGMSPVAAATRLPPITAKHSGMGIAAFVFGLASGVLLLILMVLSGSAEAASGGISDGAATVLGLFMLALLAVCAGSIMIGIFDLTRKGSLKVLPIIGVSCSAITAFTLFLLFLLGLTME